jgi:AcrR family transcriptional regulator
MSRNRYARDFIVDRATELAGRLGLSAISTGSVARELACPKSSVFHHFPHKHQLQLGVLEAVTRELARQVVHPALQHPPGLPRLDQLVSGWIAWDGNCDYAGGCLFIATATEFDDRPGPVRDHLVRLYQLWQHLLDSMVRAAVTRGELRPDTDRPQFIHDLHGILLAYHHTARLLEDPDARRRALTAYQSLVKRWTAIPPPRDAGSGVTAAPLAAER